MGEVAEMTAAEQLRIPNFGRRCLLDLESWMADVKAGHTPWIEREPRDDHRTRRERLNDAARKEKKLAIARADVARRRATVKRAEAEQIARKRALRQAERQLAELERMANAGDDA